MPESISRISLILGSIRPGQNKNKLPREWTAADFSSRKLTLTSIPIKAASSSLSESKEKASFYTFSYYSTTPFYEEQLLMISVNT